MKRKALCYLLIIMITCSLFSTSVLASDKLTAEVLIVGDNTLDTDFMYTSTDVGKFNTTTLDQLSSYSAIVVDYNELYSIDQDLYNILLDNGSVIMVYGEGLPIEEIQSYFGEIKVKYEELPVADPEASGYPQNAKEPLSDGLKDKVMLIYAYKLNGEINYGGAIDCSDEKLYNENTGKWQKVKDIDLVDEKGNIIFEGRELIVDDVLQDIGIFLDDIKQIGQKFVDMQLETNEGYVNIMMYPYNPGSTEIKCNWWSYFSPYGKMKALVYVERLEVGLWDLATSMTADADEGWCVYRFKTKTYVDFAYEDVVDWTYLPSNTGSFTVSLTYGYPTVSYTTSTDKMSLSNDVLTRAVEWTVDVNNARLYPGQAFKIEPAIRASNTYGSFWFRRYYYAQFAVPNIIGYNTPYYYTTINMEVQ